MPRYQSVAIVGVGLIGGSVGLALRQRGLADEVVGVGRRTTSLNVALERGAITRATTDQDSGVATAEMIVVCTPVDRIVEHVQSIARSCPRTALVTDVGSTKSSIVAALTGSPLPCRFVGSHPLAGDHRSGPEFADGDLFCSRTVVVTPTSSTSPEDVAQIEEFWTHLGAGVEIMPPEEHDQSLAVTSHLPHLVATALVQATDAHLRRLVASGWRDTTRIAGADPQLWRQIFVQNREATLLALAQFEDRIAQLRAALQSEDGNRLEELLQEARQKRDALGS